MQEALARGKGNQTADEIRAHLERASMQLWLAWAGKSAKGCCITELYDSALGKTCGLVVVAGMNFEEWQPLTERIKQWARQEGCVRLEAAGRAGWERQAKQDGWKKIRTVIEMEL